MITPVFCLSCVLSLEPNWKAPQDDLCMIFSCMSLNTDVPAYFVVSTIVITWSVETFNCIALYKKANIRGQDPVYYNGSD